MQLLFFLLISLNPVSQQLYKYDADQVIHKEKISLLCGNVSFYAKDLVIRGDTLTYHRDNVVLMSN